MPKIITGRTLAAAFLAAALTPAVACGQSQTQMTMTAEQSYRQADKALNVAYQQLSSRVGNGGFTVLRQAQRSWIRYRDDHCKFVTLRTRGGSAESMVRYSCLMQVTMARTQELNRHLNCREGDLSCAVLR